MDTFEPQKTIVPIVVASTEDPIQELLGTGFFIRAGKNLHLITAKHIFAISNMPESSKFAFVLDTGKGIGIWSIPKIIGAQDYDVAICEVTQIDEAVPLQFAREQPALNADIFCYEYSRTSIARKPQGGKHVSFQPLAHKGNIMRYYDSDFPEKVITSCFNTSFPALQGASGAPVIASTKNKNFYIAGMMVANQETHLLPAQVLEIVDGDDYLEETKCFLPMGKGINSSLIRQIIEGLSLDIDYVD